LHKTSLGKSFEYYSVCAGGAIQLTQAQSRMLVLQLICQLWTHNADHTNTKIKGLTHYLALHIPTLLNEVKQSGDFIFGQINLSLKSLWKHPTQIAGYSSAGDMSQGLEAGILKIWAEGWQVAFVHGK
jgi:hypothetical protein